MGEEQIPTGWDTLPESEKIDFIREELTNIDLARADGIFWAEYTRAKENTIDISDQMRLDMQRIDRVTKLRNEGKMLSLGALESTIARMSAGSSGQLLKGFSDFSKTLPANK